MPPENKYTETIRELYVLYHQDIYRFARYTLGENSSAHDVVQEVFVRAMRTWNHFRHDASEKTWLLTIARNYMNDYMRKQKRQEKLRREYEPPYIPDETVSIETAMMLETALLSLKKTYRQVFLLRHIENLSVKETALILGWSLGKVRTTDYRAIANLRTLLDPNTEEVNP